MQKYIFVSGGVISGLGKGIVAASIGLLLKTAGYTIAPLKFENYLNVDAGTINPIEHGDPFLCEDGTEADMDLGTYEKFLNQELSRVNFVTMGQIYLSVIERERRFEYKGEDVQEIVHITGEIIQRINSALKHDTAEIAIIELGGTAGEYQNILYYEASRMLAFAHPGDVLHVHVSYVPTPKHLGEPKTKPAQLSVRTLNSMGIQPNLLVIRSEQYFDQRRQDRLALFCNVFKENIFSSPDLKSVYELPIFLNKQHILQSIYKELKLKQKKAKLKDWKQFTAKISKRIKIKQKIAIVGKYFKTGNYKLKDSYAALFDAIDHATIFHKVDPEIVWIDAEDIEKKGIDTVLHNVDNLSGIIVPIGWGPRGAEGMIQAASYARIHLIPYLGLCYGMQLSAIAFARDVLHIKNANTQENSPKTKNPIIHIIDWQKKLLKEKKYGATMRLGSWEAIVKKNTYAYEIYDTYNGFINKNTGLTAERHRHRYEFNTTYAKQFEKYKYIISARSKKEGLVEIIELDRSIHPFYIGTQGHPEYKSRPLKPHPFFLEFIKACT